MNNRIRFVWWTFGMTGGVALGYFGGRAAFVISTALAVLSLLVQMLPHLEKSR